MSLPNGDPAIAAESQSVLLSSDTPDAPASADADSTDQTDEVGDESLPEAHSQSIVVDPRDRVVAHYSIGYSSSNPETRMVRSDLVERGWVDFVTRRIEPTLEAGFERIMLHNPFGIPVDRETGETQVMQFEQYLAAQQEVPTLAEGFVEAWLPITERGVEVIAYVGGPHNSPAMRALEGDMDAWWGRAWEALQPVLDAGMSIGLDNSAPRLADSPTFLLAEALRERGVRVYTEARPHNANPLWFDYPVVIRDPTWIATDPGISGQHPIVYSRFPRNDQLSSEILRLIRPNEEEDAQWSRMKQALTDGHSATVYAPDVILPGRGNMDLEGLLEFAGVGNVPTDIHLAASDQVGLTYTVVTSPQHGQLIVNPRNRSVVTYTPEPGFSGTDSFQFLASRGSQQSEAGTITLTVHSLLAAEPPANLPDPDQGTLVPPDSSGDPLLPPNTGPDVIPDGDDREALHFDPHDLPGPDQPAATVVTQDQSQPGRKSSADLPPLSSGFLPPTIRSEPTPLDPRQPARYVNGPQPIPPDAVAAGVDQVNRGDDATTEGGAWDNLKPLSGTSQQRAAVDARQVTSDSDPLDHRPPEVTTVSAPVAPVAESERPVTTVTPAAPEPLPDRAQQPAVDPADESAPDELPTGSLIAAALATTAAIAAAAAADSDGGKTPTSLLVR